MTLAHHADAAGCRLAVALGFCIPISVALDNVLLALCLTAWAIGGSYSEKVWTLWRNPVFMSALALFALRALGLAWGERGPGDGTLYLGKYSDLALIAPLAFLLRDATARAWAVRALATSLALVL